MDTIQLYPDFKDFLKSLNLNGVEYLMVGGYSVIYYGYVRSTGDIDFWLRASAENADRVVMALTEFGFGLPALSPELFLIPGRIVRMGIPPFRIELMTQISGVEFRRLRRKPRDRCVRRRDR